MPDDSSGLLPPYGDPTQYPAYLDAQRKSMVASMLLNSLQQQNQGTPPSWNEMGVVPRASPLTAVAPLVTALMAGRALKSSTDAQSNYYRNLFGSTGGGTASPWGPGASPSAAPSAAPPAPPSSPPPMLPTGSGAPGVMSPSQVPPIPAAARQILTGGWMQPPPSVSPGGAPGAAQTPTPGAAPASQLPWWYHGPTLAQINGQNIPGGQWLAFQALRDPAAAEKLHQLRIDALKEQAADPVARLTGVAQSSTPGQLIGADPELQAAFQQMGKDYGLGANPSDAQLRAAAARKANEIGSTFGPSSVTPLERWMPATSATGQPVLQGDVSGKQETVAQPQLKEFIGPNGPEYGTDEEALHKTPYHPQIYFQQQMQGKPQQLLAAITQEGGAPPPGFRTGTQLVTWLNGLISSNPDMDPTMIGHAYNTGQMSFNARKLEAAGIAKREGSMSAASYALTRPGGLYDQLLETAQKVDFGSAPYVNAFQQWKAGKVIDDPDMREYFGTLTDVRGEFSSLLARNGTQSDQTRAAAEHAFPDTMSLQSLQRIIPRAKNIAGQLKAGNQDAMREVLGGAGLDQGAPPPRTPSATPPMHPSSGPAAKPPLSDQDLLKLYGGH